VSSGGNASVRQLELPLGEPGDEAVTGTRGEDAPVAGTDLLERVLEAQNLRPRSNRSDATRAPLGSTG
jgi:hypothetical protein